jgi:hypothetical protein
MLVRRNFVIHECEGADNDLFHEMTDGTYPTPKDGRVLLPPPPKQNALPSASPQSFVW